MKQVVNNLTNYVVNQRPSMLDMSQHMVPMFNPFSSYISFMPLVLSGVNTPGSISLTNHSARGKGKSTLKVATHDGNVDVGVGRKLFSPSNQPNGWGNKS